MADVVGTIDNGSSSEDEKPRTGKVGRPQGSRSKDKVKLQERILKHDRIIFGRLLHWIRCDDGPVSLAAIKLAYSYCYGKPPERLLIGNDGGKPFMVVTPQPVETFEDWERLVKEAEAIAVNADASSS